jgi:hypothetical protein
LAVVCALASAVILLAPGKRPAEASQPLHLPYPTGVAVDVIQGYNGGTHTGVERYSLDIVRSDGKTSGSPVLAPASGTVAFAQLPAKEHGCIGVTMDDSGDFHYMLCHINLNHTYGYGDKIQVGQQLGTVAAPGLVGNNGTSHVHMQLYILPGGQRTPVPFSPPQGLPLETSAMAADGSYDQWACAGSACHGLISRMPPSATTLLATDGVTPGSAATLAGALSTNSTLSIGVAAIVQGTDDCLRVHAQPEVSAASIGCAPDGTVVFVSDGPRDADGHTWWFLRTLGWSVADYLRPSGVTAASAPAQGDGAPAPRSSTTPLALGATIRVAAAGDCLRVHQDPALDSPVINCLADATTGTLQNGPRNSDGHTWWQLDSGGWAVSDYLQAS